jgi:hypothetical protein
LKIKKSKQISFFIMGLTSATLCLAQTKPQGAASTDSTRCRPVEVVPNPTTVEAELKGLRELSPLVKDREILLTFKETPDGVTVAWTSANPQKVKKIKEMTKNIKILYESRKK